MSGAMIQRARYNPDPASQRAARRIALFNVKYSPNLGDGLLVECLEAELAAQLAGARIESLDLAGRSRYAPGRPGRALTLGALQAAPLWLRQAASKAALGALLNGKLREVWRRKLSGVSAVIVGGGNLLSDTDLNFPLKLRAAASAARAAGAPLGVYGVGVSDNWSREGAAMFRDALGGAPLFFASVRDAASADIWRRRLPGAAKPKVVCDPGLLASAHFPVGPRPSRAAPLVGIGVMHPTSVSYHSGPRQSASAQRRWIIDLAAACLSEGWSVRAFSNGGAEDDAYLKSLASSLAALPGGGANVEPRFATPGDLARFVAGLDLMYAHRLHSNIAAFSYAVPHVGFAWDRKLESFLAFVGRRECLAKVAEDGVSETVELGRRQLQSGIDRAQHRTVLERARSDIGEIAAAVRQTIGLSDAGARETARA